MSLWRMESRDTLRGWRCCTWHVKPDRPSDSPSVPQTWQGPGCARLGAIEPCRPDSVCGMNLYFLHIICETPTSRYSSCIGNLDIWGSQKTENQRSVLSWRSSLQEEIHSEDIDRSQWALPFSQSVALPSRCGWCCRLLMRQEEASLWYPQFHLQKDCPHMRNRFHARPDEDFSGKAHIP